MNSMAKESQLVKRARDKLKKKFEEADKLITPEALKKVSQEIHRWISTHIKNRVNLKDKNISLFDENQNVANVSSKYISTLKNSLIENAPKKDDPHPSLQGRISTKKDFSSED